jgi:uncharacterized protein YidB (DUF937 family)
MSLMDNLLGALGGATGGSAAQQGNPMMQLAMSLLAGGGQQGGGAGGLMDLVSAFQKNGMGDAVQSWIGTGPNQPVSGDQIQQALGGDTLGKLAQQFGLSPADASSGLASMLPQLVDSLTPNGQMPSGGLDMASIMSALSGRKA